MGIISFLVRLLPIRIRILLARQQITSRLVLDSDIFPECHSKIVQLWSWVRFGNEKILVHFKEGKFITRKLK